MTQKPARPEVLTRTPGSAPTGVLQVVHLDACEHTWEIGPGTLVHGYGYNAQVPGPTLEATVGDTLLVRFTNSLPEPSSIAWPGLLGLETTVGGAMHASTPVPPGGTVQHRLELRGSGTFGYHPLVEHTTQTEWGLYGALVVRDPAEPVLDGERVLVFSGLPSARLGGHDAVAPVAENVAGGGLLLVNGVQEAQMLVTLGHRERWRLINATLVSRLRLSLSGQPLTVTSTGLGVLAAPVAVNEVLLGPGECRDLEVGPFAANQQLTLNAFSYDHATGRSHPRRLATLHVA